jgi:hypothetical protein
MRQDGRFDRRPARGGGSRPSLGLAGLTFARAGAKFVLLSAPTTGSVAFMQQAGSGAIAYEDRGDGAGQLLLLEASYTNALFDSRDASTASWTTVVTCTVTANAGPGTDGGTTAARLATDAAGARFQARASGVGAGNPSTLSVWARRFSSTGELRGRLAAGTTVNFTQNTPSATTTYARYDAVANSSGGAENSHIIDARIASAAVDALVDFAQLEAGRYPHSVVATAGAGATSPADSLTGTAPAWMLATAWHLNQCSPIFANTDLVSGDIRWIVTFGSASDGLRISHDGTDVRVRAFAGGVQKATSQALTFSRHGLLGAVRVNPAAGLVYVNGVVGPAGTAWSWPAGNMRIGGISGGSGNELDGRVSSVWAAG